MNAPPVNAAIAIALGLCVAALLNKPREVAPTPLESSQQGGVCSATVNDGQSLTKADIREIVAVEMGKLPKPLPPVVFPAASNVIKVPEPIEYDTLAEYVIKLWEQREAKREQETPEPELTQSTVVESDIVQRKLNRVLSRLKYRPRYHNTIADGIAAAAGEPWLLVLLDGPNYAADKLMLCPAADGLVVVELQAMDRRHELPEHTWPSVALYRGTEEINDQLTFDNLAADLTAALAKENR